LNIFLLLIILILNMTFNGIFLCHRFVSEGQKDVKAAMPVVKRQPFFIDNLPNFSLFLWATKYICTPTADPRYGISLSELTSPATFPPGLASARNYYLLLSQHSAHAIFNSVSVSPCHNLLWKGHSACLEGRTVTHLISYQSLDLL
jgi:hypothetical protein